MSEMMEENIQNSDVSRNSDVSQIHDGSQKPDVSQKPDEVQKPDVTQKSGEAQKPDEAQKSDVSQTSDEPRKSDESQASGEPQKSDEAQKSGESQESGESQTSEGTQKSGVSQKSGESQKSGVSQKPSYAAILKRVSPRSTTQFKVTDVIKQPKSQENLKPVTEVTRMKPQIMKVKKDDKNINKVVDQSTSESATESEETSSWKTVPGHFSPKPPTSFVNSVPMVYPPEPRNFNQKQKKQLKQPKQTKARKFSRSMNDDIPTLEDIRNNMVAPSIEEASLQNVHVKNTETLASNLKKSVTKKWRSMKKLYRKWTGTEKELLPSYMPTGRIRRNSPRSPSPTKKISLRTLFGIGLAFVAVFGVTLLVHMFQGDLQGSRELLGTKNEGQWKDVLRKTTKGEYLKGTFTLNKKKNELKFSRMWNWPKKWKKVDEPTIIYANGDIVINGFQRGGSNCTIRDTEAGRTFTAALKEELQLKEKNADGEDKPVEDAAVPVAPPLPAAGAPGAPGAPEAPPVAPPVAPPAPETQAKATPRSNKGVFDDILSGNFALKATNKEESNKRPSNSGDESNMELIAKQAAAFKAGMGGKRSSKSSRANEFTKVPYSENKPTTDDCNSWTKGTFTWDSETKQYALNGGKKTVINVTPLETYTTIETDDEKTIYICKDRRLGDSFVKAVQSSVGPSWRKG